ncbi:hypothetical protein HZH66_001068 [Vespula vulgaris]|uniref:Uncharacterized protein n=1 Tax=Vespula vulgaris TaxID=7454 RepID=A0A834NJY2_VESVU|nr:hypothetical protein HZH66_001068 [Vespula vulgaris]
MIERDNAHIVRVYDRARGERGSTGILGTTILSPKSDSVLVDTDPTRVSNMTAINSNSTGVFRHRPCQFDVDKIYSKYINLYESLVLVISYTSLT